MELQIGRHDVQLDEALHEHIERRVEFALGQFGEFVSRVRLNLADVNGPRRGIDKECQMLVYLRDGHLVKVRDVNGDFATAVNRAADRAGHAVARQLDKRRDRKA
jgi:ribosome-associated translation inhibitor RaiA